MKTNFLKGVLLPTQIEMKRISSSGQLWACYDTFRILYQPKPVTGAVSKHGVDPAFFWLACKRHHTWFLYS